MKLEGKKKPTQTNKNRTKQTKVNPKELVQAASNGRLKEAILDGNKRPPKYRNLPQVAAGSSCLVSKAGPSTVWPFLQFILSAFSN